MPRLFMLSRSSSVRPFGASYHVTAVTRIIRKVFRSEHIKDIQIPCFINDYNHHIGGVDLANQFREAYKTHKPTCRN
jgi:hypothetical protein